MDSNKTKDSLEIVTEDTKTEYRKLEPGLFAFSTEYDQSRGPRAGTQSKEVTVNGPLWSITVGESGSGSVWVVSEGKKLTFENCPRICFVPPFSIIEMQFENLKVKFGGIVSGLPLPEDLPKRPIMFNVDEYNEPTSLTEVILLLRGRRDEVSMDRADSPTNLAIRARQYIHDHYEESFAVADMADLFEVSHSELTKSFKRAFGIPPIRFKNILRVQDSVRHLLFGSASSTEAGFNVGFEDLSRFNKNFRRIMETVPSQFSFRAGT